MGPRRIRRRRDGLVEIRRARARDLVLTSDTAVLCYLLVGFFLFSVILVMTLLFDPPALLVAAWCILYFAVEQRRGSGRTGRTRRRAPRLTVVPAAPSPPDSAA
jgi:hypothetical protein